MIPATRQHLHPAERDLFEVLNLTTSEIAIDSNNRRKAIFQSVDHKFLTAMSSGKPQ